MGRKKKFIPDPPNRVQPDIYVAFPELKRRLRTAVRERSAYVTIHISGEMVGGFHLTRNQGERLLSICRDEGFSNSWDYINHHYRNVTSLLRET